MSIDWSSLESIELQPAPILPTEVEIGEIIRNWVDPRLELTEAQKRLTQVWYVAYQSAGEPEFYTQRPIRIQRCPSLRRLL